MQFGRWAAKHRHAPKYQHMFGVSKVFLDNSWVVPEGVRQGLVGKAMAVERGGVTGERAGIVKSEMVSGGGVGIFLRKVQTK